MIRKGISRALAVLLLSGSAMTANAAELSLSPIYQTVELGNQIMLLLYGDFRDDPVTGGGLDLFFDDDAFGFVSFDFMAAESVGDDPEFRRAPDVLDDELNGISFGGYAGLDSRSLIGIFTFDALAVGTYDFMMAANEGGEGPNGGFNPGGFFSMLTGLELDVDFSGAMVEVVGAAVPVPAAVWLMLGGIGFLVRFRRKDS